MGYWEQDSTGASFARDESVTNEEHKLIWGDSPADHIDNALDCVKLAFLRDLGRLPSKAEMLAGIQFSTAGMELPDRPEDCEPISEEQREIVGLHMRAFMGDNHTATPEELAEQRTAIAEINKVLSQVTPVL